MNRRRGIDNVAQGVADDILHDNVGRAAIYYVIERHDIGVLQVGSRSRLDQKALNRLGRTERCVIAHVKRQLLDRDISMQQPVTRMVDNSHAAPAKFTDDLVSLL